MTTDDWSDEEIDEFMRDVMRRVQEARKRRESWDDIPPRRGKYKTRGGVVPVEDLAVLQGGVHD